MSRGAGFVRAEGAAFLVLERLDHARARGARVHATLTGYGRNSDAHHLTAPHPDGEGARVCMEQALAGRGTTVHAVTHVNAHGTGTELNDLAEARAIAALFGPAAVPVTAPKAVTGHALGAAGALEAVITALSVREGARAAARRRSPGRTPGAPSTSSPPSRARSRTGR